MVPGGDERMSENDKQEMGSSVSTTSDSPFSTGATAYHRGPIVFPATDTVDMFFPLPLALLPCRTHTVLFRRSAPSRLGGRRNRGLAGRRNKGSPPFRPRWPTRCDGTRILRHVRKK